MKFWEVGLCITENSLFYFRGDADPGQPGIFPSMTVLAAIR